MPDLGCAGEPLRQAFRKVVVRIGNYGDAHGVGWQP
jgi:hypothetical protein